MTPSWRKVTQPARANKAVVETETERGNRSDNYQQIISLVKTAINLWLFSIYLFIIDTCLKPAQYHSHNQVNKFLLNPCALSKGSKSPKTKA